MSLFGKPLGPTFASSASSRSSPEPINTRAATVEDEDLSDFSRYSPSGAETLSQDVTQDEQPGSSPNPRLSKKAQEKWRRETQADRDVSNSLEHLEHEDLSIHLYNAHALKRQAYDSRFQDGDGRQAQTRAKRRLVINGAWVPHAKWTAWPLKLEDTPLERERWGNTIDWQADEEGGVRREDDKPSAELQELLVAECLRCAKERLWDCEDDTMGASPTPDVADREASGSRSKPGSDERTRQNRTVVKTEDRATLDYIPTPMIDDHRAQHVLRPITQRILSDLDRLLGALHRSRINHAIQGKHKRSKRRAEASSTSQSRPMQQSRRTPRPRDWSEVLGTALQIGWDRDVIAAAQKRCEALLGEQMLLQTLTEAPVDPSAAAEGDSEKQGQQAAAASLEHCGNPDLSRTTRPTAYGWRCPEVSCPKRDSIFTIREDWLTHIEVTHGYSYNGLETIVPLDTSAAEPTEFCCPDPHCQRHDWPYPNRWRLQEHMKRSHGQRLERRSSTPVSRGRSPASQSEVSEEEMYGGVHVDGFLQPIKVRRGWRWSSSRSTSRSREAKRTRLSVESDGD